MDSLAKMSMKFPADHPLDICKRYGKSIFHQSGRMVIWFEATFLSLQVGLTLTWDSVTKSTDKILFQSYLFFFSLISTTGVPFGLLPIPIRFELKFYKIVWLISVMKFDSLSFWKPCKCRMVSFKYNFTCENSLRGKWHLH